MNARPTVFETKDELVQRAAVFVAGSLRAAVAERGRASLVLAGGSTPEPVYRLLASVHADAPFWADTHVFFGDERCVPPDHAHSNARMAHEAMLNALPIPEAQVHRMVGEVHPPVAAYDYEQAMNAYRAAARDPEAPLFDVVLLGLGDDGHTASLFPGEAALEETEALCIHTKSPPASPVDDRLTLTFPALSDTQTVLFLVSGAKKQAALHAALHGLRLPDQTAAVPASRITARGEVLWFVDRAASGTGEDGTA